ncbi:hypothetical protein SOVF_100670 isoform B [Spinacia oleracea]|nr:hypothetical protein SOVF_100670 isoform B [Spinacia oleracea]
MVSDEIIVDLLSKRLEPGEVKGKKQWKAQFVAIGLACVLAVLAGSSCVF